jgi:hypothetical protein
MSPIRRTARSADIQSIRGRELKIIDLEITRDFGNPGHNACAILTLQNDETHEIDRLLSEDSA